MKRSILLICTGIMLLFSACQGNTPLPEVKETSVEYPDDTPSAVTKPTSTPTLAPTPTPTPTLNLPVMEQTAMPIPADALSPVNAANIGELMHISSKNAVIWEWFANEKYVVYETNQGVLVYPLREDKPVRLPVTTPVYCELPYYEHTQRVYLSPDNMVAVATYNDMQFYSVEGELLSRMLLENKLVADTDVCGFERVFRYSPDMKWLAVGHRHAGLPTQVYDIETGEIVAEINAFIPHMFTPDRQYLIIEDNQQGNWRIYRTSDWSQALVIPSFGDFFSDPIGVSPDGRFMVGYPSNKKLTVYSLENGRQIAVGSVECTFFSNYCDVDVFFSKDGNLIGILPMQYPEPVPGQVYDLKRGLLIGEQSEFPVTDWQPVNLEFPKPVYYLLHSGLIFNRFGESEADSYQFDGKSILVERHIIAQDRELNAPASKPTFASREVSKEFCAMKDGEDVCASLPPFAEWNPIGQVKTIAFPVTGDLAAMCIHFPNEAIDCFPVSSPNPIGVTDLSWNEETLEFCFVEDGAKSCLTLPPLSTTWMSFGEYQTTSVLLDKASIYCWKSPTEKMTCLLSGVLVENAAPWFIKESVQPGEPTVALETPDSIPEPSEPVSKETRERCVLSLDSKTTCNAYTEEGLRSTTATGEQYTLVREDETHWRLEQAESPGAEPLGVLKLSRQETVLSFQMVSESYVLLKLEYEQKNTVRSYLRLVDLTGRERLSESGIGLFTSVLPDGRYVAGITYNQGNIRGFLWDVAAMKTIFTWTPTNENVDTITFTPDSRYFVYTNRERTPNAAWEQTARLRFLDLGRMVHADEKEINIKLLHTGIHNMTFSPDGTLLALGLTNGEVRLLNVNSKAEAASWQAHIGMVDKLFFSPDGRLLFSSGAVDLAASVWGVLP